MSRNTVAGSGGKRKSEDRDPLDRYYTPPDVALGVCRRWADVIAGRCVVDPFAGGGAWLDAAMQVGAASVGGCDMDPDAPAVTDGRAVHGDGILFVDRLRGGEVIVTNPPFCIMDKAMEAMLSAWQDGRVSAVIVLGRLSALEGVGRAPGYRETPPERLLVPAKRMRWDGPAGDAMKAGTDNFGAAVVLWRAPTVYGQTMATLGWSPEMEDVGKAPRQRARQASLFGGGL